MPRVGDPEPTTSKLTPLSDEVRAFVLKHSPNGVAAVLLFAADISAANRKKT